MKLLIIGFTKIKYMPYIHFYLEHIDCSQNEVHIFFWNRSGEDDDVVLKQNVILHEFKMNQEDDCSKIKKIPAFLFFKREIKKLFSSHNFEFIIVLQTLPAILLYILLKKRYKERYIYDYRDFTFENIPIYKKMVADLTLCSSATFVSSNAFREYLPQSKKIYTSHNILLDSLKHRSVRDRYDRNVTPIRIRYWGLIRYARTNIELIKQIANDYRFEMHFHGRYQAEALKIKEFCGNNQIENVFFHKEYLPNERYYFIAETDILQNAQDFDLITCNAVSNKFYDGAIFYIPQLCTKGSYMGELVEQYGLGLAVDVKTENIAERLYDYYNHLEWDSFRTHCDNYIKIVLKEFHEGVNLVRQLTNS